MELHSSLECGRGEELGDSIMLQWSDCEEERQKFKLHPLCERTRKKAQSGGIAMRSRVFCYAQQLAGEVADTARQLQPA